MILWLSIIVLIAFAMRVYLSSSSMLSPLPAEATASPVVDTNERGVDERRHLRHQATSTTRRILAATMPIVITMENGIGLTWCGLWPSDGSSASREVGGAELRASARKAPTRARLGLARARQRRDRGRARVMSTYATGYS